MVKRLKGKAVSINNGASKGLLCQKTFSIEVGDAIKSNTFLHYVGTIYVGPEHEYFCKLGKYKCNPTPLALQFKTSTIFSPK